MKSKVNTQKYLVLIAALFLGLSACKKQEEFINQTDDIVADAIVNSYTIDNNFANLNKRVTLVREPIVSKSNLKIVDIGGDCFDYTWYLVAEVESPIVNGKPLSATDVRILGDRAYVSYHRQGDEYSGAIDIIDISDAGNPTLRSFMEFDGVDINSLAVDDMGSSTTERKIWMAGSSFKKGAVLRQVITNNSYLSSGIGDIALSKAMSDGSITASANSIGLSNDYIYMTSGSSKGGTFQLNRQTLDFVNNEEYSEAKAIALNGNQNGDFQLSLIGGDNAKLKVHQVGSDRSLVREISLGSIVHQNVNDPYFGKATVSIRQGEKIAFIAMNQSGMKAVNIETGNVVYTSPSDMLTTGNTHGLAIDEKFIYMANSDDGLFIGCIPQEGGEIQKVQQWDLDQKGASVNMVQTDGDWVFVAKGGGGLKILRKVRNSVSLTVSDWDEKGAPRNKTNPADLCENIISSIDYALKPGEDATKNNKKFFENMNREVVLTQAADVSVTFVAEGAGYTNSFGYYTYNKNNPPQSVEDIHSSMKIVFANMSAVGSGGGLVAGDQVSRNGNWLLCDC